MDSGHQLYPFTSWEGGLRACGASATVGQKIPEIGDILCNIFTTRGASEKRRAASDSAHQIGRMSLSDDVFTQGEGVRRGGVKNSESRVRFSNCGRTSEDTVKQRGASDSGHQIGVITLLDDVLTAGKGVRGGGLKIAKAGSVFDIVGEPVKLRSNGGHHWIQRIK